MFVTLDGSKPSPSSYQFSSSSSGSSVEHILLQNFKDEDNIFQLACETEGGCSVRVGVEGYKASSYILNVVSSDAVSLLQVGVPRNMIVSSGQTLRLAVPYSRTTRPNATHVLRIAATTQSGRAIMKGFCFMDDASLHDVCVPKESDTDSRLESQVANLCTAEDLDCGPIQEGGAHYQPNTPYDHAAWVYDALYRLNRNHHMVSADAACLGRIEIGDDGGASFPDSAASGSAQSVLSITPDMYDRTCGSATMPNKIFVGIFGYELSTVQVLAEMEVAAEESTAAWASLLTSGQPQASSVGFHRGRLFKFVIGNTRDDIDIAVTVGLGNVDVFVSTSEFHGGGRDSVPRINQHTGMMEAGSYTWSSASSVSQEEVSIVHTDPHFCYDCVYYVLVYGAVDNTGLDSQFSVVVSTDSAPVTLRDGVPQIDKVRAEGYAYFQIALVDPAAELSVSVVPLWGDPDVFIDSEPNTRPTRSNTRQGWQLMRVGGDAITIQVQDLLARCDNSEGGDHAGRPCHYYIGVTASGQNCSFVITASLNSGWVHPQQLVPGIPSVGRVNVTSYNYYQISVIDGFTLSIALNPLEGGDSDLYVSFSRDIEPGRNHYDLSSSSLAVDVLSLTANKLRAYCAENLASTPIGGGSGYYHTPACTVYIAVYGFEACSYSLTASVGVTMLQDGVPQSGRIDPGAFMYYQARVSDPDVDLRVEVTPLTGDVDLYVGLPKDLRPENLPSRSYGSYIWRQATLGADELTISHNDPKFCYDCVYTIGVFGYRNSTFTILSSAKRDAVVNLIQGRPQRGHVASGGSRFYSFFKSSSSEDMEISLTVLSGDADIYVAQGVSVGDILPNPADSSSYVLSSENSGDDRIVIPNFCDSSELAEGGGAKNGFLDDATSCRAFTIGTFGKLGSEYQLTVSTASSTLQLVAGVAQRHFVAKNGMEHFVFNLDDARLSLSIVVTAISGNPEIFVSTRYPRPVCTETYSYLHCSNYTWKTQYYGSTILDLAHEDPCANADISYYSSREPCDASEYKPGPFYITVVGRQASEFTVVASARGDHMTLIQGVPQLQSTQWTFLCEERDEDGKCQYNSTKTPQSNGFASHKFRQQQAAFFKFSLGSGVLDPKDPSQHLSFSIRPQCNFSDPERAYGSDSPYTNTCLAGCPCSPLSVYVKSCQVGKCAPEDAYPSADNFESPMKLILGDRDHANIFVEHSQTAGRGQASSTACDLNFGACDYYIGVYVGHTIESYYYSEYAVQQSKSAVFTVTANTPSGIRVLPRPDTVDGLVVVPSDSVSEQQSRYFEANVHVGQSLRVSVDTCVGDVELYVCDSTCETLYPSQDNFRYFTDHSRSCSVPTPGGRAQCQYYHRETLEVTIAIAESENYFIAVVGDGVFQLRVTTGDQALTLIAGGQDLNERLTVSGVGQHSAIVSWLPAIMAPTNGILPWLADMAQYTVFFSEVHKGHGKDKGPVSQMDLLQSECGVDSFDNGFEVQRLAVGHGLSAVVDGLQPGSQYVVNVMAECDEACVAYEMSKANSQSAAVLAESVRKQRVIYTMGLLTTTSECGTICWLTTFDSAHILAYALLALLVVGIILFFRLYKQKKVLEQMVEVEMTAVSTGSSRYLSLHFFSFSCCL
jgi:hypothetical protein